jgi:hypothetical protein
VPAEAEGAKRASGSGGRTGLTGPVALSRLIEPDGGTTEGTTGAGLTLYAIVRELQHLLVVMAGACHTCHRPFDNST